MKYPRYIWRVGGLIIKNLFWINNWSRHLDKHPLEDRYKRFRDFTIKLNKGLGIEYHVTGEENIPVSGDKLLIIPNHQSMIDPLLLMPYFDQPISFVAKIETKKVGVVRKVMKLLDGEYIDRNNLRQEIKLIRHVTSSLKDNYVNWTVFAEGSRTRNEDYQMNELKAGTFKIAIDSHQRILPVAIFGGFRVLSTKYKNKINPIQIHFFKPIEYDEYRDKKSIEIAQMLEDLLRPKVFEMMKLDRQFMEEINTRKKKRKISSKDKKTK